MVPPFLTINYIYADFIHFQNIQILPPNEVSDHGALKVSFSVNAHKHNHVVKCYSERVNEWDNSYIDTFRGNLLANSTTLQLMTDSVDSWNVNTVVNSFTNLMQNQPSKSLKNNGYQWRLVYKQVK